MFTKALSKRWWLIRRLAKSAAGFIDASFEYGSVVSMLDQNLVVFNRFVDGSIKASDP